MNGMTWAPVWEAVLAQLVVPTVVAGVSALGAYLITLAPGPVQRALSSGTRKRDIELVLGAMTRKGIDHLSAGGSTATLPTAMIDYVKANLPDLITKLAPSEDALQTMASSAVADAAARIAAGTPVVSDAALQDVARSAFASVAGQLMGKP